MSKTISNLISEARNIAQGISANTVKQAAEALEEAPKAPKVETAASKEMRKLAAELKSNNSLDQLKLAAVRRIVEGDMPSRSDLTEAKLACDFSVERGATDAETLRNLAGSLRAAGEQLKTAAHVGAFKKVRGLVAAEKLDKFLG